MPPDLDTLVDLMPFAAHLGVRIEEASADRAVATLEHRPELCTAAGVLHGGVLMSLADSLGAAVTFLGLPEGASTATIIGAPPYASSDTVHDARGSEQVPAT